MYSLRPNRSRNAAGAALRRQARKGTPFGLEPLELRALLSTYYVATNGNDANAGTAAAPFKRIQIGVSHLKAGDTLNIEAGTYSEGVSIGWDSTGTYGNLNGTASAPITIQADPSVAPGSVIISGQNNKTHDGIDLEPGNSWLVIKGITVNNNTGTITRDGIHVSGSDNVSVLNCTVTGVVRFGIFCSFTTNFLVQGNSVSNTVGTGSSDNGHGIYISNSDVNPTIRSNLIFNNATQGLHLNGDISQGGTGMIQGALIEGNIIRNNGANGINGDGVTSSRIQNNIIYGNGKHGIVLYQIDAAAGSTGNVIVNNTIVQPNSSGAAIQLVSGSANNTVYNNVLIGGSLGSFNISNDSKPGFVSDYNAVVDHFENDDTGATYTLSSWRTAMAQDAHSFVSNATALFVNPGSNDYHLKSGSPAINAGTSMSKLPPATDFDGNARPQGGAYDVGAYEFGAAADTTPPTLSAISAGTPTTSGANVTWTTNEPADSQVEYGTTTAYGNLTSLNSTLVTSHNVALSGLTAGTTYHYRVKSKDASGNLGVSGDFTFTTAVPADTTAPTGSLNASDVTTSGGSSYTFSVVYSDNTAVKNSTIGSTDVTVTGPNGYSQQASLVSVSSPTNGSPITATYRVTAPGGSWDPVDNGTYTVTMNANEISDTSGNFIPPGSLGTFRANISSGIPLVLSSFSATPLTAASAAVTWVSNVGSDSQVQYGLTNAYGSTSSLDATMVTNHSITLTGLAPGVTYHYRVLSHDAVGNLVVSSDMTFTTPIADINGDGIVNVNDLVLISANFGLTGSPGSLTMAQGDVNGDGVVNINDLVLVSSNYGMTH